MGQVSVPQNEYAAAGITAGRRLARSRFYVGMGLLAMALAIVGFGPALFVGPSARRGAPTTLIHVHGVVFAAWLCLFLAQATLVHRGNRRLHKRLGWLGIPLAIAAVVLGYATTLEMGRRGHALWWHPEVRSDVLTELVHPIFDLLTFSLLVTGAFIWRKRADVHKRLLLLATVGSMMPAPLAHALGYAAVTRNGPPVIVLLLAGLYFSSAVYDRVAHGRVHPVSLWGGVALFAIANLRATVIGPSDAWHQFARWLIG